MKITFHGNSEKATKVTITSDKLLRIKDCTVDLIKSLPFKTKIRGIGSWDTEESRRTLYGYAMYVNFDYESNGPYLARYKNEEIVEKLIESIRKKRFKKNVTYKDGKKSEVEVVYNLGNIGQLSRDEVEEVLEEEAIENHPNFSGVIEEADGSRCWYLNGKLHRDNGPATEHNDGSRMWYLNGHPHREGGPAIEQANGTRMWYRNGEKHRDDGPAIEWNHNHDSEHSIHEWWLNGEKVEDHPYSSGKFEDLKGNSFWYLKGKLHREDGPAIEYANGSRKWYINGELHRVDGPAVEYTDGCEASIKIDRIYHERHRGPFSLWYLNGKLHRDDGPAIELEISPSSPYLWNLRKEQKKSLFGNRSKIFEYRWYLNDKLHRVDGPAIEDFRGNRKWYLNGQLQREEVSVKEKALIEH